MNMCICRFCLALVFIVPAVVFSFSTDEEIKERMARSVYYCHSVDGDAEFAYAFMLCDSESNRFARLIRELSQTNDLNLVESMLYRLGQYGSTGDVEYLSHCVELGRVPVAAATAVLHLQGVCSNSISAWARSVACTNADASFGELLCDRFIDIGTNATVDVEYRTMIKRELAHHAINHYFYNPWYDQKMTNVFPDYTYSFARLQALSNGLERNTFYYNLNYITNALRELSEIPASEFHEFP